MMALADRFTLAHAELEALGFSIEGEGESSHGDRLSCLPPARASPQYARSSLYAFVLLVDAAAEAFDLSGLGVEFFL